MNYLQKFQGGGSFGSAFNTARNAGLDEFQWNGRWYTTEVKAEKKTSAKENMSEKQRQADQIEKLNQSIIGNTAKAFQISPEDRKYIRPDVWDMVMQDHGNKIKPGSKEWKMIPREYQSKIFNNDVTRGISQNGSKILTGMGAVVGGSILLPQLATAALANPISTGLGMVGSKYGGDYVNDKIRTKSNGKYQGVGDYVSQKTHGGIPQQAGDLLNPGTWIGGGIGSAAGNTVMRFGRNIPIMWNNAIGTARNAPYVNNGAGPRTVFDTESGQYVSGNYTNQEVNNINRAVAESGKSSATRSTGYSKAGGGKQTGTRSGASGRPYSKGSTVGGGQTTGQQVKGGKFVASEAPEYQPMPWVQTPNGYGALPVFAPGQGPIAPAPKEGVRVEKVSDELAEWKSWYEKQPSGTYQSYPGGGPRKGWKGWIDRTGHDIASPVREIYATNPGSNRTATIIPDSTSRGMAVTDPTIRQRILQGAVPKEAKRGAKTIKYKKGGQLIGRKEGGSINYLNQY